MIPVSEEEDMAIPVPWTSRRRFRAALTAILGVAVGLVVLGPQPIGG